MSSSGGQAMAWEGGTMARAEGEAEGREVGAWRLGVSHAASDSLLEGQTTSIASATAHLGIHWAFLVFEISEHAIHRVDAWRDEVAC